MVRALKRSDGVSPDSRLLLFESGLLIRIAALSVTTFYLLSHRETLAKLIKELEQAIPDSSKLPSVATLEQLPYLISTPNYPFLPTSKPDLQSTAPSSPKVSDSPTASSPALNASPPTNHSHSNPQPSQSAATATAASIIPPSTRSPRAHP